MKTCDDCKYANWKRTKNGRLHPNKSGRCTYPWECPKLPAAFDWLADGAPTPWGGHIERGEEHKKHCPYWTRRED